MTENKDGTRLTEGFDTVERYYSDANGSGVPLDGDSARRSAGRVSGADADRAFKVGDKAVSTYGDPVMERYTIPAENGEITTRYIFAKDDGGKVSHYQDVVRDASGKLLRTESIGGIEHDANGNLKNFSRSILTYDDPAPGKKTEIMTSKNRDNGLVQTIQRVIGTNGAIEMETMRNTGYVQDVGGAVERAMLDRLNMVEPTVDSSGPVRLVDQPDGGGKEPVRTPPTVTVTDFMNRLLSMEKRVDDIVQRTIAEVASGPVGSSAVRIAIVQLYAKEALGIQIPQDVGAWSVQDVGLRQTFGSVLSVYDQNEPQDQPTIGSEKSAAKGVFFDMFDSVMLVVLRAEHKRLMAKIQELNTKIKALQDNVPAGGGAGDKDQRKAIMAKEQHLLTVMADLASRIKGSTGSDSPDHYDAFLAKWGNDPSQNAEAINIDGWYKRLAEVEKEYRVARDARVGAGIKLEEVRTELGLPPYSISEQDKLWSGDGSTKGVIQLEGELAPLKMDHKNAQDIHKSRQAIVDNWNREQPTPRRWDRYAKGQAVKEAGDALRDVNRLAGQIFDRENQLSGLKNQLRDAMKTYVRRDYSKDDNASSYFASYLKASPTKPGLSEGDKNLIANWTKEKNDLVAKAEKLQKEIETRGGRIKASDGQPQAQKSRDSIEGIAVADAHGVQVGDQGSMLGVSGFGVSVPSLEDASPPKRLQPGDERYDDSTYDTPHPLRGEGDPNRGNPDRLVEDPSVRMDHAAPQDLVERDGGGSPTGPVRPEFAALAAQARATYASNTGGNLETVTPTGDEAATNRVRVVAMTSLASTGAHIEEKKYESGDYVGLESGFTCARTVAGGGVLEVERSEMKYGSPIRIDESGKALPTEYEETLKDPGTGDIVGYVKKQDITYKDGKEDTYQELLTRNIKEKNEETGAMEDKQVRTLTVVRYDESGKKEEVKATTVRAKKSGDEWGDWKEVDVKGQKSEVVKDALAQINQAEAAGAKESGGGSSGGAKAKAHKKFAEMMGVVEKKLAKLDQLQASMQQDNKEIERTRLQGAAGFKSLPGGKPEGPTEGKLGGQEERRSDADQR